MAKTIGVGKISKKWKKSLREIYSQDFGDSQGLNKFFWPFFHIPSKIGVNWLHFGVKMNILATV